MVRIYFEHAPLFVFFDEKVVYSCHHRIGTHRRSFKEVCVAFVRCVVEFYKVADVNFFSPVTVLKSSPAIIHYHLSFHTV